MVRAQSVYVQNGELMRMSSCKCLECLEGMYCPLKHNKTRHKHMLLLFSAAVAPLPNVKAPHATEALNSMQAASGNPDLFTTPVTLLDAHTDCIPEQSSYAYVQHE